MFTALDLRDAGSLALCSYWLERCPDGRLMRRSALDPVDLGPLLANILLIEATEKGTRLVIRLAGDAIEARYGCSLRGQPVDFAFAKVRRQDTSHQWREIVTDATPKYRRGPMIFPNGHRTVAERVLLPLSEDGSTVTHILGGIFYSRTPAELDDPRTVAGSLTLR